MEIKSKPHNLLISVDLAKNNVDTTVEMIYNTLINNNSFNHYIVSITKNNAVISLK